MAADLPPPVDAVVVQAARLPPAAGEAVFSSVRISPELLATSPRLDEALTDTPGVSLFRRTSSLGANPTTQGVSLRSVAGSGASRALVTLDGVPQNDPFGGWVIWTGLPSTTVESARIVRGAGAGPYGAGALTGVVALEETAALPKGVFGEASLGGRGYGQGSAAAELAAGAARVLISASREHSDGWTPIEPGRRGAVDEPLALDAWSGALRVQSGLGRGVMAVRASAFEEERSAGVAGAGSRVEGAVASLAYAAAPAGGALGWRVQAWARRSDLRNTSAAVAPGRAGATPASDQYETPAWGYGVNAAVRKAGSGGSLELGADLRLADGESRERFRFMGGDYTRTRVAGGKALVGGVYAEASRTRGGWLVAGGVRLDRWRSFDARRIERDRATGAVTLDTRPADRGGLAPTARAGARRELGGGLHLRAAAYAGFRPATLNELHRPFRVGNDVTEANAALKPERLYGAEAGVGHDGERRSWSAGLFYNRIEDAVANVTVGFGPATFPTAGFIPAGGVLRQRRNAGAVDAYGMEAEAHMGFAGGLTLHLGAGYTHAEVDGGSAAPQLTGLRPAQTPRFTALVRAGWRIAGPLTARVDVRYEGARFDDDLNLRRLAPGLVVDARVDARLAGRLGLFVSAENLMDASVDTAVTADGARSFAAPRLVRAGLTLRR